MDLNRITTSLPGMYAKALYDVTEDNTEEIIENFNMFFLICDKKVHKIFSSHNMYFENIGKIFDVLSDAFNNKFVNFIKVLVYNGRYKILSSVKKMYCILCDKRNNIQRCTISSVVDLTLEQKSKLESDLQKKYHKFVQAEYILDPSIIAGIVVKTDEQQIDMSVKNELDQLYKYLRGAYHEK